MNTYDLRAYLLDKAVNLASNDGFKCAILKHFGYGSDDAIPVISQFYKRCAVLGFLKNFTYDSEKDIKRLLGQAHQIDGTPSPWVSDLWAVLGIKIAIEKANSLELKNRFKEWINDFLPQRIKDGRLDSYEKAIAQYLLGKVVTPCSCASIALFLHFQGMETIADVELKEDYKHQYLNEFKEAYTKDLPAPVLAILVYVFDQLNKESALTPPNSWSLNDVLNYLNNIPIGLRKWTWEDKPRTAKGNIVKWPIENEYHVQNLLYILLAPIFNDITDEIYIEPVGQKNPRIDLYLPSSRIIIEVKYRKDTQKTFQSLIGEIAEDASLYRSDPKYKNCCIIAFLWDRTKATQEYAKFKEGVLKISGINGCVIVSAPSMM